jgi:hypothetical protein
VNPHPASIEIMEGIISQSNFIPWRGYFATLRRVRVLVLYDSQQFTRRDWRNRNIIRGKHGPEWLTVPVATRGHYLAPINKIRISDSSFFPRANRIIRDRYKEFGKTEGFEFVSGLFDKAKEYQKLSDLNLFLTHEICQYLEIDIKIENDSSLQIDLDKNSKLIYLCKNFGISSYYSGPTAKDYLDIHLFSQNDLQVSFFDFSKLVVPPQQIELSIIHHLIVSPTAELNLLTRWSN